MIYSDEENKTWWKRISHQDKQEIFETMISVTPSNGFSDFAESLLAQWEDGKELSAKQLAHIRKWEP